jgi:hypothetical protein
MYYKTMNGFQIQDTTTTGGNDDAGTTTSTSTTPPQVADNLAALIQTVESITDPTEAMLKAQEIISSASGIMNSPATTTTLANQIEQSLLSIANTALDKVNTETITSITTGTSTTAVIRPSTVTALTERINTIAGTAGILNGAITNTGMESKVEAVLKLDVPGVATATQTSIQLPTYLLMAAQNKLDKIAVQTSVATIAIAPNAIATAGAQNVTLEARKVAADELPENVRERVGDSQVYDFNAFAGANKVSQFSTPVDITVPYTLKPSENPALISVFFINDAGFYEQVTGVYDAATGTVKFATTHFSKFVIQYNAVTFADLASFDWAKESIEVMASKGMVKGMGNDLYKPGEYLTRAQFVTMVLRVFGISNEQTAIDFSDVNADDWFFGSVSSALKAGIVSGRSDGTFAPNEQISRQDMSAVLANALSKITGRKNPQNPDDYLNKFSDSESISEYAQSCAAIVAKYGIISGKPGGNFAPQDFATRAEAAAVIYRVYYLLNPNYK